jgi:hypothetical protein
VDRGVSCNGAEISRCSFHLTTDGYLFFCYELRPLHGNFP